MIKEFEPPFLYKTPSIIEEKIKRASTNLLEYNGNTIPTLLNHYINNSYSFNNNGYC